MTIRADSFSSTSEVKAFTRHLLKGQSAFNSTTRPSNTELEKFIDKASGVLNVAIAQSGFSPSSVYTNSTAKLSCDDWVTMKAAKYVELTQRGTGYSVQDGSRIAAFDLNSEAVEFAQSAALGFVRLGISQGKKLSDGLSFTGLTVQSERTDPDDTSFYGAGITGGGRTFGSLIMNFWAVAAGVLQVGFNACGVSGKSNRLQAQCKPIP